MQTIQFSSYTWNQVSGELIVSKYVAESITISDINKVAMSLYEMKYIATADKVNHVVTKRGQLVH